MHTTIYDNFLKKEHFESIQNELITKAFPFYPNKGISYTGDGLFQLVHVFYDDGLPESNWFSFIKDVLVEYQNTLPENVSVLPLKIKANLGTRTKEHEESEYHTDQGGHKNLIKPEYKTGILYLNTCNGYTEFKGDKQKYSSQANRFVVFDGNSHHRSVSQTDTAFRYVINFNWIEKETD